MLDRDPCPPTGETGEESSAITATAGFVASAALHLATFTPFPPAHAAAVALVLFAGAFVLLAALIVRLREAGAPARGQGAIRMVEWRSLVALIPPGARRAGVAVLVYVLMNLALSLFLDRRQRRKRAPALRSPAALLLDSADVFSLRGAPAARRRRPAASLTP